MWVCSSIGPSSPGSAPSRPLVPKLLFGNACLPKLRFAPPPFGDRNGVSEERAFPNRSLGTRASPPRGEGGRICSSVAPRAGGVGTQRTVLVAGEPRKE